MDWLKRLRRKELEGDFDRELRYHIEELTQKNTSASMGSAPRTSHAQTAMETTVLASRSQSS
jgi:hypothetical protein